jgi:NADPH:quinone reductase-like Zn-dependent oxidoreductase
MLHELGVDQAIDYTTQRFEDVASDVDIVLDTIGSEMQERSWDVLKKGGRLVSLLRPPSAAKAKALGVRGAFVRTQPNGAQLTEIAAVIDSGNLKPVVSRILPLSEVRRAHKLSQDGHTRGKMVLRVNGPTL